MSSPALAERYGASSPWRRRVALAVSAVVVAAFAAWVAWTVLDQTSPQVTSEIRTFEVTGEHNATAVVAVSLSAPDVRASCTLRAFAADHSVVGELRFDPTDQGGRIQTRDIRTERRATSVDMVGCTAPGQNRPR